jgi:hypothetical protein
MIFFTISNILSKNNVVSEYNYSTIEYVKFVFASIRGGHTLFFCFKESPTKNTIIQFNYNGIAPERELHFLKSKGVNVVIYPKNKLKL